MMVAESESRQQTDSNEFKKLIGISFFPVDNSLTARAANRRALEGDELKLYNTLVTLRKKHADQRGIAPYMIFSDKVLEQLARLRPTTSERFGQIEGVQVTKYTLVQIASTASKSFGLWRCIYRVYSSFL